MLATCMFGVLRPFAAVRPFPERNTLWNRSRDTAFSASPPMTPRMLPRRMPPISSTSTSGASNNALATSTEFVATMRRRRVSRCASACVVVPRRA